MPAPSLYADLSHYYDLLCSNIDYREQSEFAMRAYGVWGNGSNRYLDMACGSGALLAHFQQAGFRCSGLDMSEEMLALAAKRCPQASLMCSDMRDLQATESFDFISCFLYSIHYCASLNAMQQTFERIYAALAPGGLFCFDAVDKDRIANDQGHFHCTPQINGHVNFQTRWHYPGKGDDLTLYIDIREQNGEQARHFSDQHTMRAVNISAIQILLHSAGFSVEILEHDFSRLSAWNGTSGNVVFCALKDMG